jgi:phytoene dehydrogenase-like protein
VCLANGRVGACNSGDGVALKGRTLRAGDRPDALVLGAGLNGLAAAAALARAGRSVTVIEKGRLAGGALAGFEVDHAAAPGLTATLAPEAASLPGAAFIRRLGLACHGVAMMPPAGRATVTAAGRTLVTIADPAPAARAIAALSPRDGARFEAFRAHVLRLRAALPTLFGLPDAAVDARVQRAAEAELLIPLEELLARAFDNDLVMAHLALPALRGQVLASSAPGSAFGLIARPDAMLATAPRIAGPPGLLARALARAATAEGAELRLGMEASGALLSRGRVTGVALADGETIAAPRLISTLDAKRTILSLFDWKALPEDLPGRAARVDARGVTSRAYFVLDGLPPLTRALAQTPGQGGSFAFVDGMEEIEAAAAAWRARARHDAPPIEAEMPSANDPARGPHDRHLCAATIHFTPQEFLDGPWTEEKRTRLLAHTVERLARAWPDIANRILSAQLVTPGDLEARIGLTAGAPWQVDLTPAQLLAVRGAAGWPQGWRVPKGLVLAGRGAWPGAPAGAQGLAAAALCGAPVETMREGTR